MNKIIIIGGGIAGLSAAYYTHKKASGSNLPVELVVLESNSYWGGKIVTEHVDDFVIEGGPDTFIVTKPWAVDLCEELGIADRLKGTNPEAKKTYILKNNHLHELPGGLTLMIPTDFSSMLRTGLLSWQAKMRMGMDFLIPPISENGDETLGKFVSRRLGRSAYENLIEPLMSGIYAGDGDKLSLQATFPYLRDLERKHGGLVRGALAARRQRRKPSKGSRSIFLTPLNGLAEIVNSLVQHLKASGVKLNLNAAVNEVKDYSDGYRVEIENGETLHADSVILAAPPYVAGDLIAGFAPDLGDELRDIEYASTATVTLAYRDIDLPRPLDGYGYVIPRSEGRKALACTWTSTKFPHRAPQEHALIRVFIGRAGQNQNISWNKKGLLDIAREELRSTLGISASPLLNRIYLWERAMPQYNLGHPERLARIEYNLNNYPDLALAGNGYHGIGIPDCIHSGELAADRVLSNIPEQVPI